MNCFNRVKYKENKFKVLLILELYNSPSKYSFIVSHLDQYIRSTAGTFIDSTNEEFTAAAKKFYFNNSINFSNKDKVCN